MEEQFIKITLEELTLLTKIVLASQSVVNLALTKQLQRAEPWQQQIIDILDKYLKDYIRFKGGL